MSKPRRPPTGPVILRDGCSWSDMGHGEGYHCRVPRSPASDRDFLPFKRGETVDISAYFEGLADATYLDSDFLLHVFRVARGKPTSAHSDRIGIDWAERPSMHTTPNTHQTSDVIDDPPLTGWDAPPPPTDLEASLAHDARPRLMPGGDGSVRADYVEPVERKLLAPDYEGWGMVEREKAEPLLRDAIELDSSLSRRLMELEQSDVGEWVRHDDALAAIEEARLEERRRAADLVRESVGLDHNTEYSGHVINALSLATMIERGIEMPMRGDEWIDGVISEYCDVAEGHDLDIEREEVEG